MIASTRLLGPESPLDGPTIGHVERQAASLWGFNPAHPFWTSRLARRGWNRKTKLASLSSHDLAALELLLYGQTPPKLAVLYDFAARLSLSDLATTLSDWLTQSVAESAGAALLIESGPAPHLSLREAHVEGELFSTIEEVHVFRDGKLALSGSLDSLREQWLVATAYFAEGPPESLGMEWASRLAWFGPERAVLLVERPRRDAVEERLRSLKPLGFGLAELRLADLGYFCGTSSPWRAPGGA